MNLGELFDWFGLRHSVVMSLQVTTWCRNAKYCIKEIVSLGVTIDRKIAEYFIKKSCVTFWRRKLSRRERKKVLVNVFSVYIN
jgi:hypothetical protein